jgi:AcrR family transcriptional regulator
VPNCGIVVLVNRAASSTAAVPEPAWRQRAIDRSTQSARLRAQRRVQRFLDAAQAIISEKGSTEFTVQEVVERSKQSLRSFYQYFDGKHELLLALFEEELEQTAATIRDAAGKKTDPLDRLRATIDILFMLSQAERAERQPIFSDFSTRLLIDHPEEVAAAFAPLFEFMVEMMEEAAAAGLLRAGKPRHLAALVLQTAMFAGQAQGIPADARIAPISADEVWEFCLQGIASESALAERKRRRRK